MNDVILKGALQNPVSGDLIALCGRSDGSLVVAVGDNTDGEVGAILLNRDAVLELHTKLGEFLDATASS